MKAVMFELLKIKLGSIMMGEAILEKKLTTYLTKVKRQKQ